jgi:Bax protein
MPYIILIFSLILLSSCSDSDTLPQKSMKRESRSIPDQNVEIRSIKELNQLFNDLNYTSSSWKSGLREVPRIYFSNIGTDWKKTSDTLPVKEKKNIFFRLIAPLVLISNEEILKEREKLLTEPLNSAWMLSLAKRYRVIKKESNILDTKEFSELKKRVDIIPLSLALAQGAEESGWGTSRFASEGNALFGLWDYSGNGMRPAQQRKELGNYGLARYDTPLDSVKGYMFNINIGHAFTGLRDMRERLRKDNKKITGWELAKSLGRYSERGQEYIDGLHDMMKYNKLSQADDAYLSDNTPIHLIKGK